MPQKNDRHPGISVYQKGKAGTWYARYRDASGKQRNRSLRTRDRNDAESQAEALASLLHLHPVDPHAALPRLRSITVSGAIAEYSAMRLRDHDSRHMRENLRWSLGKLQRFLGAGAAINACFRRRQMVELRDQIMSDESIAPPTRRAILGHVRRFSLWARDRGYLLDDPDAPLKLPAGHTPRREVKYYKPREVRLAVEAAALFSPDGEAWVLMAVMTGLRASELCRLLWRDVDLRNRVLRVETHDADAGAGIVGAAVKCPTSRRSVPIEEPLLSVLQAHEELTGRCEYVFAHPPERRCARAQIAATLARTKDEAKRNALYARLRGVVAAERDQWCEAGGEGFTHYRDFPRQLAKWIHEHGGPRWDCRVARHTFATTLITKGTILDRQTGRVRAATLYDLKLLMGHASITTTERHYFAHVPPQVDLGLAEEYGLVSKPKLSIVEA